MDIVGKKVKHKSFGYGMVVSLQGEYIAVAFDIGEKRFPFPDIFSTFISFDDQSLMEYMDFLLQKKETEKAQLAEQKRLEQQKQQTISKAQPAKKPKYNRANIAFKCNYCDGGKSDKQVGFDGGCSDAIIHNNICVEKRTACNADGCACLHYLNKKITRKDLDNKCLDGGFVCYENQMLRDWKALAGIVQNGDRKGEPMKLHQVQRNSLCILTTRIPNTSESERFIFGVFLVDETYEGDGKDEGYVSTSSKYKLKLSPNEAKQLLFWDYHANGSKPEIPAWSSGLHRYFEDDVAVQILRDIIELKKNTIDYELATEFLEEFCKVNGVEKGSVGEARGALKRN